MDSMTQVEWGSLKTEQKLDAMRNHCGGGQTSAQMVHSLEKAGIQGVSRNAIIGMVHRHKVVELGGWTKEARQRGAQAQIVRRVVKPKAKQKPRPAPPRAPECNPVELMSLPESGRCKFPLWNEPTDEKLYCGGKSGTQTYCAFHANVMTDRTATISVA